MSVLTRVALAAALLTGAGASAASADGPPVGSCHVYQKPPIVTHSIPDVPQVPGQPYLYCDY